MFLSAKYPGKEAPKRPQMKRTPQRSVTVIKHFQPQTAQNADHYELPTVIPSSQSIGENVKKEMVIRRISVKDKKKTPLPKKDKIVPTRTLFRTISTLSQSSSSSSEENRNQLNPHRLVRSKSFSHDNKHGNAPPPSRKENRLCSTSGSALGDAENGEIMKNLSDTSPRLTTKMKERQERVDALRKEISQFIEIDVSKKTSTIAELKTEIGSYRSNKNFYVFNVHNMSMVKPDCDQREPLTNRTEERQDSLRDESRSPLTDKSFTGEATTSEKSCCQKSKKPKEKRKDLVDIFPNYAEKSIEEAITIQGKIKKANILIERVKETLEGIKFKASSTSTTSLTETECSKPTTGETSTDSDKEETPQVDFSGNKQTAEVVPVQPYWPCIQYRCDGALGEDDRPKTRRSARVYAEEHFAHDRFRTSPPLSGFCPAEETGSRDCICRESYPNVQVPPRCLVDMQPGQVHEVDRGMELLKTKLTAITELTTESESEKQVNATTSTGMNTSPVPMTSSAMITEPTPTISKETQYIPTSFKAECSQTCANLFGTETTDGCTQAGRQLGPLVTVTSQNARIASKSRQIHNLVVQHLPAVVVASSPTAQRLLHYSIELDHTNLLYKNSDCNVGFYLVETSKDDPPPDNTNGSATACELHLSEPDLAVSHHSEDKEVEDSDAVAEPDHPHDSTDERKGGVCEIAQRPTIVHKNSAFKATWSLFKDTMHEDSSPEQELNHHGRHKPVVDRERVLKSYHVYDNINDHDPGVLSQWSMEMIRNIDDSVYRTYIDPKGFQAPPNYEIKNRKATATRSKMSTVKVVGGCGSQTNTSCVTTDEGECLPRFYSLGLFANKSTQMSESNRPASHRLRVTRTTAEKDPKDRLSDTEVQMKVHNLIETGESDYKVPPSVVLRTCDEIHKEAIQQQGNEDVVTPSPPEKDDFPMEPPTHDHLVQEDEEKRAHKKEKKGSILKEYHKLEGDSYETISLTVSYETFTSSESNGDAPVGAPNSAGVQFGPNTDKSEEIMSEPLSHLSDEATGTDEKQDRRLTDVTFTFKEMEVLKRVKNKISNDPIRTSVPDITFKSVVGMKSESDSHTSQSIPAFICGLTQTESTQLRKVIPRIRSVSRSVLQSRRARKSDFNINYVLGDFDGIPDTVVLDKPTTDDSKMGSNRCHKDEKDLLTKYTAVPPESPQLAASSAHSSSPLSTTCSPPSSSGLQLTAEKAEAVKVIKETQTDWTKEEAHADTSKGDVQTNSSSREVQTPSSKKDVQVKRRRERSLGVSPFRHKHKHSRHFKMETSNSEFSTTEKSKSEGEINCHCNVSFGELHSCMYDDLRQRTPSSFHTDELFTISRTRRTYFNNWITYYVNREPKSFATYAQHKTKDGSSK